MKQPLEILGVCFGADIVASLTTTELVVRILYYGGALLFAYLTYRRAKK